MECLGLLISLRKGSVEHLIQKALMSTKAVVITIK